MNFGTAIKTCFNKYADFDGRASRSEYFFFFLFVTLTYVAIYFIAMSILINTRPSDGVAQFLFIMPSLWALAMTLPLCAACARRLHDVNRSGWWQMAPIGLVFLSVFCFYQFPDTPRLGQFILVGSLVYVVRLLIWLASEGTTKGYTGPTKRRTSARNYDDAPKSYSAPKKRSRSGKADLTDELEELQELYEDGTLSEAQFKKAKNKLLK